MTKLTKLEADMLKAIINSQYHDGTDVVGHLVWFENPFTSKKTA